MNATAKEVRWLMPKGTKPALSSIGRMLNGADPMNPDVFSALVKWTGLPREELSSEAFLSSEERVSAAVAATGKRLHDLLRKLREASVRKLELKFDGLTTQKVVSRLPTELQLRANHLHLFKLIHKDLTGARLVLLEYEHESRRWWSLLDNRGAMIGPDHDHRVIDAAATLPRDGSSILRFLIGADPGVCEIFAIASTEEFPDAVMLMLSRPDGSDGELRVDDQRLNKLFSRWIDESGSAPLVASVTYVAT